MDRRALTEAERLARVRASLEQSIAVKQRVVDGESTTIVRMAEVVAEALGSGGKILFCGNGGSAADAQHLATELLVRLRPDVERGGLAALALALDSSSLTAYANDFGFEGYYARLVDVLGEPGDVLVGLSTTGRSQNVVLALRAARAKRLKTLGLLGGEGGEALAECDLALVVPSASAARVQEAHIAVGHALLELAEDMLIG